MSTPAEPIIGSADIPSIPHVLEQILAVTSDPSSSSRMLEEKILQEPGLVTHLLKTVNSAYYGFSQKIASVNQAIVLLGFSSIRSMASGLALIDAFNNLPGLNRAYVLQVWEHCLGCAGLVKELARELPRNRQDELFLSAMVHDVGHIVLAQYFSSRYDEWTSSDPFPSVQDERERFEVDHAEAGAALLGSWRFAEPVVHLVGAHHQRESFQGDPKDLILLQICDGLMRSSADLEALFAMEASQVDAWLIDSLQQLGWTWPDLRDNQDPFLRSVEMSREIIRG
jgi:HD-like signal output (HDOD) protein